MISKLDSKLTHPQQKYYNHSHVKTEYPLNNTEISSNNYQKMNNYNSYNNYKQNLPFQLNNYSDENNMVDHIEDNISTNNNYNNYS